MTYESANEWDEVIIQILPAPNSSHISGGMTTNTRSTTLGNLPIIVTWCMIIIPDLSHRAIGHSNIRLIPLLVIHLGINILSTIRSWVPVYVPLGTFPYILTRFTTAVTVAGECNLLSISTSATHAAPNTATTTAPSTPDTG